MAEGAAVCLLLRDENEYLEEWLLHYAALGFREAIIYDNMSIVPVDETIGELDKRIAITEVIPVSTVMWPDNGVGKQQRAYLHCCNRNLHYRWIGFFDTDEFLYPVGWSNIDEFMEEFEDYRGLGVNWRIYGDSFLNHRPRSAWDYRFRADIHHPKNAHIKSIIDPRYMIGEPRDPHFMVEGTVNEKHELLHGPLVPNVSSRIFVKHNFTRSLEEWIEKTKRGRGDGVTSDYTLEDFYVYRKEYNEYYDPLESLS